VTTPLPPMTVATTLESAISVDRFIIILLRRP
jgi:hypothetical protein